MKIQWILGYMLHMFRFLAVAVAPVCCTSPPWSFPGAMSVGEVVEGRVLRVGEESPGGTFGPRLAGL